MISEFSYLNVSLKIMDYRDPVWKHLTNIFSGKWYWISFEISSIWAIPLYWSFKVSLCMTHLINLNIYGERISNKSLIWVCEPCKQPIFGCLNWWYNWNFHLLTIVQNKINIILRIIITLNWFNTFNNPYINQNFAFSFFVYFFFIFI